MMRGRETHAEKTQAERAWRIHAVDLSCMLCAQVMTGHHNHKILYAASLGDAGTTDTGKPILSSCPVGSAAILSQKKAALAALMPASVVQAKPKDSTHYMIPE